MKKFIVIMMGLFLISACTPSKNIDFDDWSDVMTTTGGKISALPADTSPDGADGFVSIDDIAGTPANKLVLGSNLHKVLQDADDDGSTKGVATFDNTDFDAASGVVSIVDDAHAHTTTSISGVLSADFGDEDWGDISVSTNTVTLDADIVAPAEMADADHGDFSWLSGSGTIDEDVIDKANFADEDWGDISVSTNSVTLDADVVGSDEMGDEDHGDVTWASGVASVEDDSHDHTTTFIYYTPRTSEPTDEVVSGFYAFDNNTYDPGNHAGTNDYLAVCTAIGDPGTFKPIFDVVDGIYLFSTMDGVTIGGTTPVAAAFTTATIGTTIFNSTTTTLSTAEVNALKATPIALVASGGANTITEFVSAVITYDYATAAFTVAGDEDLVIEYADGTDVSASIETTGFLDQADDEIRYVVTVLATNADLEASINQGLQIFNTGAGETADGGGEVDVRVTYRVYSTGF